MNIMIVDTTSSELLVYIKSDNKEFKYFEKSQNNQAEMFNGIVKQGLDELKLELKDINNLYVAVGPGSYTGVRIGITFAKVLNILNKELKVLPFNSLMLYTTINEGVAYRDAKSNKLYCLKSNKMQVIEQALINVSDKDFYTKNLPEFEEIDLDSFVTNIDKLVPIKLSANYLKDANATRLSR